MANTTTVKGRAIQITGLDADWYLALDMTGFAQSGLRVDSIVFHPSGANDEMVIKDSPAGAVAATPKKFRVKCSGDTDQRVQYYKGETMFPFIDISSCSLASASAAMVVINIT